VRSDRALVGASHTTVAAWAAFLTVRYGEWTHPERRRPGDTASQESQSVQGVIKAYDPSSKDGIVVRDTDLAEVDLAPDALEGSVFRLLRQGQRVIFDLDGEGRATRLRLGSEVDMGTPGLDPEAFPPEGGSTTA
jgi:cold shock CspA family protein